MKKDGAVKNKKHCHKSFAKAVIAGHVVHVKVLDEDAFENGEFARYMSETPDGPAKILLNEKLFEGSYQERLGRTLWHECFHAWLDLSGWTEVLPQGFEEGLVKGSDNGVFPAWRLLVEEFE